MRRLSPFAALLPFLAITASAQQDRISTPRISAPIDSRRMVVLRGHVPSQARPEFDRGPVDSSFQLPSIVMHLQASTDQKNALQVLLAGQQDPSSANYRQWLTPQQYASRFGLNQNDIDQITAWLASQGFQVTKVSNSRTWIEFSGTAAQAQQAFHTEIHRYQVNGAMRYAPASDPSIPAALAGIVSGFRGLNNFHLKPRYKRETLTPDATSGSTHHIVPDDFAAIYNVAPLYQAGVDGSGQKIVIVGQTDIKLADIQSFRNKFNLPAANVQQVLVPGHTDPGISQGDLAEADLDIEWAGAVARNATIVYVYSDDVVASARYAVDQNLAPVMSMSYGSCEDGDLVDLTATQSLAQQANAQGITWLAAAGDAGAADCEDSGASVAQNGLAVDSPGSVPEITAMGGSELIDQGGSYWSASNTVNGASALSYIPERVWNDTALNGGLSAGGGGASKFFFKPAWQTGPGVPNDGFRHVPDLSLSASADHDGYYVYSGGSGGYFGGTSVAAPSMAGIVALLNQYLVSSAIQSQAGVGNINPALYRLAEKSIGVFHDITVGDNIVPCAAGSPGCDNGSYGKSAGPAYDEATGLGSPDAYNLIHQWTSQPPLSSAVVASVDQNPVFQLRQPDANGNSWAFTVTLTEEAGVGTTLTAFTLDGKSCDIAATFGNASLPPNGSVSSKNLGLPALSAPKLVSLQFSGVDASGRAWTQQLSVPFSGPQIPIAVAGIGNAASGQQAYAPGMILSIYGTQMGDRQQSAATIPLPNYLAGFEATVNGVLAPLYYVSPEQVNVQIPYETQPGTATLMVGNPYLNATYTFQVSSAAPGIFQSRGFVAAPFSSARRGQTSTLFITGEGQVRPALATGSSPSPSTALARLPKPNAAVTVTIGGESATVAFVGIPSGLVGVTQINYQIPADAPLGIQPVVVTVGAAASMPASLTVTQ